MQKTIRLYENDSFCRRFTARVEECAPTRGGWQAVLDRTAFFPEGGGQPCDLGTLSTGETTVNVLDVHEREGRVVHTLDGALPAGGQVTGELDWARRLDAMEQHTGEHILSGTLHRLYGAENVGFHIGPDLVRMDMSLPLTAAQLAEAEAEANRVIRADRPVVVSYPSREELAALTYRSKKEIEGQVRLVEMPGADLCACCGTHLASTGQAGLVKILSAQNYKGGTRLAVASGGRAFAALAAGHDALLRASQMVSAKPLELPAALERLLAENAALKAARAGAENHWFEALAAAAEPGRPCVVFAEGLSGDSLRRLALACFEKGPAFAAAFTASAQGGMNYAVAAPDARPIAAALGKAFAGRGGGKPPLCQGSVSTADFAAVESFLKNL